jgi:hypothetical protein
MLSSARLGVLMHGVLRFIVGTRIKDLEVIV